MCQMRVRANETDIKNSPDENKQKKENDHYAVKIKFMNKNIETPLREQESVCSFNRSFCIIFFLHHLCVSVSVVKNQPIRRLIEQQMKTMRKTDPQQFIYIFFQLISLFIIMITALIWLPNSL